MKTKTTLLILFGAVSALGLFLSPPAAGQMTLAKVVGQMTVARAEVSGFFQPTPLYYKPRTFSIAPDLPGAAPGPHWTSDTSRTFCGDGHVVGAANAAGEDLTPLCNDYDAALLGTDEYPGDLNLSQTLIPHQVAFSPILYYPLCSIGIGMPFPTPGDSPRVGWDFTTSDGFTYAGCYGVFEPVAVPGIDQKAGETSAAHSVYLANSVSDYFQDLADNVLPYLDSPWGDLDPVNIAFEVDPIVLEEEARVPISVTVGNFITKPISEIIVIDNVDLQLPSATPVGLVAVPTHLQATTAAPVAADRTTGLQATTKIQETYTAAPIAADTRERTTETVIAATPTVGPRKTPTSPVTDILGNSGFDIAILKRGLSGGKIKGYINLIPNRGMNQAVDCTKASFAAYCGACPDPFNNADYNANCKPCIDGSPTVAADPTIAALNSCPKVMSYSADDVSDDLELDETDDPVFIGTLPASPIMLEWIGIPGAGRVLVVANRGPIDCFALDQDKPSIRFRNPKIDSADGSLNDKNGDSLVDIFDSEGIEYYKRDPDTSTTIFPKVAPAAPDPGSDRCGYLTFYKINMDAGGKPSVEIIKDTTGEQPLKIPVGFNPTSLAFGDYNLDGKPDIIVANTGSQGEKINGSISVVYCNKEKEDFTPNPGQPFAATTGCPNGYVVDDTPINNTDFRAFHPWWINSNVFKGHMADLQGADGSPGTDGKDDTPVALGSGGISIPPADAAVSFIDSWGGTKGDVGVLFNSVDDRFNPTTYKHWTDVTFEPKAINTDGLASATVKRLASSLSLYPLGISSGLYSNSSYKGNYGGLDVLMNAIFSLGMPGFRYTLEQYFSSQCAHLAVGLNNSRYAAILVNPTENLSENLKRCTGDFVANDANKKILAEATTPIYNKEGNWGPHHLGTTYMNLQTERGMRQDGPFMMYNKNWNWTPPAGPSPPSPPPYEAVIDAQLDFSPDLGIINGAPIKIAEHKVLSDAVAGYTLPNDTCKKTEFEIATVVRDTSPKGTESECSGTICAGPDPTTPHRCWQRYGLVPEGGLLASACCLALEGPPGDPTMMSKLPSIPPTCPSGDPLGCCVIQNAAPGDSIPTINWTVDGGPTFTGVTYDGPGAPACQCTEEREAVSGLVGSTDTAAMIDAMHALVCCLDPEGADCKGRPEICAGVVDNPETAVNEQECCVKNNGDWAAMFADPDCVPPGDYEETGDDCTNLISAGGDITIINYGQLNICCQVISNPGTMINTSIVQNCINEDVPPGVDPSCEAYKTLYGDMPSWCNPACATNPQMEGCQKPDDLTGSQALAEAACSCADTDPANIIQGVPVAMTTGGEMATSRCDYAAPAATGPLSLTAAATTRFEVIEGDLVFDAAGAKSISTTTPTSFVYVKAPRPTSLIGEYTPGGKVRMSLISVDGTVLSSAVCDARMALGIQGGAMGEGCSCGLWNPEEPRSAAANLLLVSLLTAVPFLFRRRLVRVRIRKR